MRASAAQVGCGTGSSVYPVLAEDERIKVHCCDFSKNAVELVKKHALYDTARVNAFHCDITQTPLTVRKPNSTLRTLNRPPSIQSAK